MSPEAEARRNLDRFLVRLSTRFVLDIMRRLTGLFDGDALKGLVFIAFVQANVGHLDSAGGEVDRFDTLDAIPTRLVARPVRATSLAAGMGIPRETFRRKVAELTAEGWLVEVDGGLVGSPVVAGKPDVVAAIVDVCRLACRFYADCLAAGVGEAPRAADPGPPPYRGIMRITLAYVLRVWEEVRALFGGDLMAGLVFFAVADANTSYLLDRGGLEYAGTDEHVPDEMRRPVSALAVSRIAGLPRETVRRHIRKLEEAGACLQVQGGVIAPQAALRRAEAVESVGRNARNVRLLLARLKAIGAQPDAVFEGAGEGMAAGDREKGPD